MRNKRKEDLENTKKIVVKFRRRLNIEVKKQEKLDITEKWYFRKEELL